MTEKHTISDTARMQMTDASLAFYAKLTVKQAASLAGVSERQMYLAFKLHDSGNTELIEAAGSGKMTIPAALKQLGLMQAPSRLQQAKTLWPKLTQDQQRDFYQWIESGN